MTPLSPPSIAELTDRLMNRAETFAVADVGDVEPYEQLHSFPTEARTAYVDSLASLRHFGEPNLPLAMPGDWANYVNQAPELVAIPMAAGYFPQLLRDMTPLLNADSLARFYPPAASQPTSSSTLRAWATKKLGTAGVSAFATSILRQMGVASTEPLCENDECAKNEAAAACWVSGDGQRALKLWLAMPDHPVVLFNRGMAYLFLGHAELAVAPLRAAAASLPDQSGWCHLAALYLNLAEAM